MSPTRPRLLFCPAWFPNRFNEGFGVFNLNLAKELSKHFDLAVLYLHVHEDGATGHCVEEETSEGFRLLRMYVYRPFRFGPLFPFLYTHHFMRGVQRLYGVESPDLVFVRGILPGGLGARTLKRRRGTPFVTLDSFSGFADQMRSPVLRWFVRRILCESVRNAGVSTYQCEILKQFFPEMEFEVRTNVIARSEPRESLLDSPEAEFRMLYVGNLVPVKGWDILLEAFRRYLDTRPGNARLTLIGGGDDAALHKQVRTLKLESHVDYPGPLPHDQVREHIAAHHVLVLPSRVDTCPNVILEAFMEGRPVLATRSGGAEDLVTDATGFLVDKESPSALCDGMARMREQWASFDAGRIREHVIEHHSLESLVGFLNESIERGG